MYFGAAYYPEHRDSSKWDYDLDKMMEANVNALRVGEFSWSRFEPQDGMYDFSWMDVFAEKALKRGIKLLICPPLRTAPAWLVEKDPSILLETEAGIQLEFGSRYTFCINHPLLREKGIALAEAMAKHYGKNDQIIGWHIDNELGDEPDCHCPICKKKWQNWLESRYRSIDKLNEAWGAVFWSMEFGNFGQVPTPRITKTIRNAGHVQAWCQFKSECTIELIPIFSKAIRPYINGMPITTNNQTWNTRNDYYEMAKHLDICGTNYYPPYGENGRSKAFALTACRSYKKKNFMMLELSSGTTMIPGRNVDKVEPDEVGPSASGVIGYSQSSPAPGEVEKLTMHAVANGADAIYYYRWRACPFGPEQPWSALTDFDGRPKRSYYECKAAGEKLKKLSGILEGTEIKSDVAILYDFPTRWTMESPMLMGNTGDNINLYVDLRDKLHKVIRGLGCNCDAVGRDGDFEQYKMIVVPIFSLVDDNVVAKLCKYVENGGTLIWHPLSGMKNTDAMIYPGRLHPELESMLGVKLLEYTTASPKDIRYFTWQGKRYKSELFYELPVPAGAKSIGQYTDTWFEGDPAITENNRGKGKAYFVTTFAEEKFYEDFLSHLCNEVGIRPILNTFVPKSIEIVERSACDGRRIIFLLSYSRKEETVTLDRPVTDAVSEELVVNEVVIEPFGFRILKVFIEESKG